MQRLLIRLVVAALAIAWWLSTAPTLLRWDPVTRDRRGGLELAPVVYEIRLLHVDFVRWQLDAQGELQPVYDRWQEYVRLSETSMPLPDPLPGCALAWWDPVAIDAAGNRSDDP